MPINLLNILPRWVKGTPPARVPLFDFCRIVRNILETATGIDRGTGAGARDGLGWHFGSRQITAAGGIPDGYEEGTVITDIQYASGYIQIKTATSLIKTPETPAEWENAIEIPAFND